MNIRPYIATFGAEACDTGVAFSLYAPYADELSLVLYDSETLQVFKEVPLNKERNKIGSAWSIEIADLPEKFGYGWRIKNCPGIPGLIEDPKQPILDPFAKGVISSSTWNDQSQHYFPLAYFEKRKPFDWQGSTSPVINPGELIIYEAHVRGFTQDKSSKVEHPGTYLGFIEKLPHLVDLGVNAIELMPLFEFNEREYNKVSPTSREPLFNYWGYSTVQFNYPMNRYASSFKGSLEELQMLVRACHKVGIAVILDVVYNHTAEGGLKGPLYSFKALDPHIFYIIDGKQHWLNYTGCGNTLNSNHPFVIEWLLDSLRWWAQVVRVDGFRFDLASIFMRSPSGAPLEHPPVIEAIVQDPILKDLILIAEPWDAAGLYMVGKFDKSSKRWLEWNGQFRDTIRRFIKGDPDEKGIFATRLCGSSDLYGDTRSPFNSVNFVTAHDGFTLNDLVSYNHKHNESNGEKNLDGMNDNASWNCGVEGPTDRKDVLDLRLRQMKNLHLAQIVSRGTLMLLMGDEYHHTKNGNNNSWCHDNSLNWFLWDELEKNSDFYRFYKGLIKLRKKLPLFTKNSFLDPEEISWYSASAEPLNWADDNRFLAYTLLDSEGASDIYIAFNADYLEANVTLPSPRTGQWYRIVNTALPPPDDLTAEGVLQERQFTMPPYSSLLLISR